MKLYKLGLSVLLAFSLWGCDQSVEQTETAIDSQTVNSQTIDSQSQPVTTEITGDTSESSLPDTAPTYTLVVDHSYPPFSFKDQYGLAVGYDIDILEAIGEEAGFKVEVLPVEWDGIFERLDNDTADLVGGVSINPERANLYELTQPHVITEVVFAYMDDEERTYEELTSGTISVQDSTSYLDTLRQIPDIEESQIHTYPTSYLAFTDILTGKSDAAFNNRAILEYEINAASEQIDVTSIRMLRLPDSEDSLEVFALKKGNTKLLNLVNDGLATIKQNGKYDEINSKWFANTSTSPSSSAAPGTVIP